MKKRIAGIIAAIVLSLLMFRIGAEDTRFSLNMDYDSMYLSNTVNEYGAAVFGADVRETHQFDLQPGTYTFTLVKSAVSKYGSGLFELVSPDYISPDNVRGRVFASVEVSYNNLTTLKFSTGEVIRGARLRVTPGTGVEFQHVIGASTGSVYTDGYAVAAVTFALCLLLLRKIEKSGGDYSKLLPYLACLFAALVATLPICRLTLPYAHDLTFHLARIEGVYESLRTGQIPVRMNTTYLSGYGYIDQIMYPPLFLYLPAALRLLRVSPLVSYQLFIFAINLATAGVSLYAFRRLLKRCDLAVIASFAYTLCAFRLICVFTRAAVGELLALVFLPLILLGMYELIFCGDGRKLPLIGDKHLIIGFSGLINSHVVSLDVIGVLCVIFCAANIRRIIRGDRLLALLRAAAFVLLLNAWVILPMITAASPNMIVFRTQYNSAEDAVYPFEMFSTFNRALGLSGSLHMAYTAMPLTVGSILGIAAALFLLVTFVLRRKDERGELDKLGIRLLIVGLTALFIASTLFPWTLAARIPFIGRILSAVQFPWRYFGAASLALCAVLAAAAARVIPERADKRLAAFICCVVLLMFAAPYIDMYMQDPGQTGTLRDKHAQLEFNYLGGREYIRYGDNVDALLRRGPVVTFGNGDAGITGYERDGDRITFDFYGNDSVHNYAELPVYWYPGWSATINGEPASVSAGANGILCIEMLTESGESVAEGTIAAYYSPPLAFRLSELTSALTLALMITGYLVHRNRAARTAVAP